MIVTPIQATPERQYKGMRYVPIFDGDWDNSKDYDPLTIVSYQGNSYTSRTFVPAGTDISNETYWALTGNYNAQVEAYRQEVENLSYDVDELNSLNDIFFDGDYNITRFTNSESSETFIYWRLIPATYKPRLAYISENDVDYAVSLVDKEGATCGINASRWDGDSNDFFGYFRNNHVTIHGNDAGGSDSYDILTFKNDKLGSASVDTSTTVLNDNDYEWALTGFKTIIEDGSYVGGSSTDLKPRSFIAQTVSGDYIIACSDGRSPRSAGLSYSDIYDFITTLGYNIDFCYNLDGGGSVTLVEKGSRVNSYIQNENRKVKSVIYFKKDDATYNELLQNCVSNIDNDFRSRNNSLRYMEGDLHAFQALVNEDESTGTGFLGVSDLGTRHDEASIRFEKDRVFFGLQNEFSNSGNAYNILDIYNRDTYKKFFVGGVALSMIKERLDTSDASDSFSSIPSDTGFYRIYISDGTVATNLGLSADDYGVSALIRIRTNANHDLLLTRAHVWYRWDNGTWYRLDNA